MHNITSKLSSGSDHRRLREAAQYNQAMSCINHFLWATQTRWGEIKETCLEKHEMKQRDAESYQTNHENNTQKNVSFFAVNEYIKLKYSIEWTRCCRAISCACTTTVWLAVVSSGVNTHQQTWLPSLFIRPSCLPTSLKERCKSSSGGPTNFKCITATYWAGVCASLLPEIKQLITLIFACDELIKLTFLSHSFKKRRMNNNDLIRMWFPDCVTKWPLSAVMKH